MTTAALPDALSDAARKFAAGPHRLLIGGERIDAADGRSFETVDPSTGQPIAGGIGLDYGRGMNLQIQRQQRGINRYACTFGVPTLVTRAPASQPSAPRNRRGHGLGIGSSRHA